MSRHEPHVRVFQPNRVTHLSRAEWESLNQALDMRATWWCGLNVYGDEVRIRCDSITDVHFVSRATLDGTNDDEQRDVLSAS